MSAFEIRRHMHVSKLLRLVTTMTQTFLKSKNWTCKSRNGTFTKEPWVVAVSGADSYKAPRAVDNHFSARCVWLCLRRCANWATICHF